MLLWYNIHNITQGVEPWTLNYMIEQFYSFILRGRKNVDHNNGRIVVYVYTRNDKAI